MKSWVLTTALSFWSSSIFKKLLDSYTAQLEPIYVNYAL
jgi:hypothetical protein